MAIPSIALIPSGYKANKVYSVLPTDGAGDLTFTRASSATRVNKEGLIETVVTGVPRLDYSDGGCPSLLLEPQATNLVTYSEDFTQGYWNTASTRSLTISSSPVLDLRGGAGAFRITATASDNQLAAVSNITNGLQYTNSIYVRRVSGVGSVILRDINNTANTFSLSEADGWKRISSSGLSNSTTGRVYLNLNVVGDVIDVFGVQLEQQYYATSYTPTAGAISTRLQDTASKTGLASYINSSEGVFFYKFNSLADTYSSSSRLYISGTTVSNHIRFEYSATTNLLTVVSYNGSNQAALYYTLSDKKTPHKVALKYKENDFALFVNGLKVSTALTGLTFPVNTLNTINMSASGFEFYGNVKDVRVYNTALTDAELTTLTTL